MFIGHVREVERKANLIQDILEENIKQEVLY